MVFTVIKPYRMRDFQKYFPDDFLFSEAKIVNDIIENIFFMTGAFLENKLFTSY